MLKLNVSIICIKILIFFTCIKKIPNHQLGIVPRYLIYEIFAVSKTGFRNRSFSPFEWPNWNLDWNEKRKKNGLNSLSLSFSKVLHSFFQNYIIKEIPIMKPWFPRNIILSSLISLCRHPSPWIYFDTFTLFQQKEKTNDLFENGSAMIQHRTFVTISTYKFPENNQYIERFEILFFHTFTEFWIE